MTKDDIDTTLFSIVTEYNRLKSIIELAHTMVTKGDIKLAKDYLNIAQYTMEHAYIKLERLQRDVEHAHKIYKAPRFKKYDTSINQ